MKYHRLNHNEVFLASDFFADFFANFFGAVAFGSDFTSGADAGGAGAGAGAPPFIRSLSLPIIPNQ
tara:strand:+ start:420 stop:617 length:198 start_codon:yes stop_codon:yes gene_type:complete